MPYPRDLLNEHEEIAVEDHPHWLYFLEPLLVALATVAVLVFLSIVMDVPGFITTLGLLVLLAAGLWALFRLVNWRSVDFVVTTDRVIYRSGVFAKRGIEIRTDTTLVSLDAESVLLSNDERIPARTLVWTAGVKPFLVRAA